MSADAVNPDVPSSRRIEITLHKPWLKFYAGIRPTLVIRGLGQPTQWGHGTWQVPAGETVRLGVFLFNRMWRFGAAEIEIDPVGTPAITYRAPVLPFGRGRITTD